jgi:hypothetical protein
LVWDENEEHSDCVARFLLIFYEIIENNAETLPHLKQISLDLYIQAISPYYVWVDSVYKDGILSASLKECNTECDDSERDDLESNNRASNDSESNDLEDE